MGRNVESHVEFGGLINPGPEKWPGLVRILSRPFSEAKSDSMSPILYRKLGKWMDGHTIETYGPLLRAFTNMYLPRTANLRQLGILPNPADLMTPTQNDGDSQSVQRISQPRFQLFDHRRITHCLFVAYHSLLAAERLGLSTKEQALMAAAGLQHDVGHAALSHVGDVVLDKITGTTHEDRSLAAVKDSYEAVLTENKTPDIAPSIREELGRNLGKIGAAIKEEPGLGQLLKVIDTAAYLWVDLLEAGLDLHPPQIVSFLGKNIFLDANTGLLRVDDDGKNVLIQLLNVRRAAYAQLYTHPVSLIAEAMHIKGLERLMERGAVTTGELQNGRDDDIFGALLIEASTDPKSAQLFGGFYPSATTASAGIYIPIDVLSPEDASGMSQAEIESKVSNNLGMDPADFVVVLPQDPGRKAVRVVNAQDQIEDLTATDQTIYHPLQGKVIIACRSDLAEKISGVQPGFTIR